MAVTASVNMNFAALLTGAAGGLGVASVRHPLEVSLPFTDGTGANQVNKVWSRLAQSITASGNETWDMAGALTDALGTTVVFTKVKAVVVRARSTNTNNVVVGGATNALAIFGGATHTVAVKPGGLFVFVDPTAAGVTVGAGTTDELLITNSGAGTAVVYDIAVLGS